MSDVYETDVDNEDFDSEIGGDDYEFLSDELIRELNGEEPADQQSETNTDHEIPSAALKVASNKGKYYLTNDDLLPAVTKAIEKGVITDELARMLMLLAYKYSLTYKFRNYSYREDMVGEALINLCTNGKALQFNIERSKNPFAYYTTAIYRSFCKYMREEKRNQFVRDKVRMRSGFDVSHNFNENPFAVAERDTQERKTKRQNGSANTEMFEY